MTNLKHLLLLFLLCTCIQIYAQKESPYHTEFWTDAAWLTSGFALSGYGLYLIQTKEDLTIEELNNLNKDDIWAIDRWAAGNNSESASKISDIPFYSSFAIPLTLLLNKEIGSHAGQISVMYLESLSTTAALFSITAGLVDKSRPRIYNMDLDQNIRLKASNQRSFYSGHVAAAATATFFAAQILNDFFPDSKANPYIWAGAAAIPAAVGYFRIQSGNHFLSDVILGYALGAATGVLVPRLHRKKEQNLKISSNFGQNFQTIRLSYTF